MLGLLADAYDPKIVEVEADVKASLKILSQTGEKINKNQKKKLKGTDYICCPLCFFVGI